jgi:hypothetical protein
MAKKKRLLSILSGFERARPKPIEINIDVNFTNVLLAHFLYKIFAPKNTKLCFGLETFLRQIFV